jgi:hypothetical protein
MPNAHVPFDPSKIFLYVRKSLPNIFNSAPNPEYGHSFTPFLFHVYSKVQNNKTKEKKNLFGKDHNFLSLAIMEQIL